MTLVYHLSIRRFIYVSIPVLTAVHLALYLRNVRNKSSRTPVLLWWTKFMPQLVREITCENDKYHCILSSNRNYINDVNLGAILFYGSRIENNDFPLPRNHNVPWAVFHEESPKNYAPFLYEVFQGVFNLTSTFSVYSSFPVPLQYLHDISSLTDLTYYIPVDVKKSNTDISPVLYIQSDCDTPIGRDRLVEELGKYVKIDSYGKCLNNRSIPQSLLKVDSLDLYNEEYLKFISKYKFIIAIENSVCDDYVTEKFWRPLIVGSVPIYLGAPNIQDWSPNESSVILINNFSTIEELAKYINDINENDSLYNSFLQHKTEQLVSNDRIGQYILNEHPIIDFECFVCKKIHNNEPFIPGKINVYHCPSELNKAGTWDQHWKIGKCQAKALALLIEEGKPYSAEEFEQKWLRFYNHNSC